MSELLSCKFNIDTACVELRYADGEVLSIYTPGIEGSFDTTIAVRAEMDWLIYNAPLEYAQWCSTEHWNSTCKNPQERTGWM